MNSKGKGDGLDRLSHMLHALEVADPGEAYWRHLPAKVLDRIAAQSGRRRTWVRARKPLAAVAAALIAALGAGIILSTFRGQDVLAATLEAMAEIKTAHIVTTSGEHRSEAWYSADHGLRREGSSYVRVLTAEGTWQYLKDESKLTISEPRPDTIEEYLSELSGARWLDLLKSAPVPFRYRVSDVVLDGKAAKRLDAEAPQGQMKGTLWIAANTMRVVALEEWEKDEAGHWVLLRRTRVEYDMPVDLALFTFQPPPGATVIECRLEPELREVIKEATEAARTLPIHELGRAAQMYVDGTRHWDAMRQWEAWRENGIGFREEYADGEVKGGSRRERWLHKGQYGMIEDVDEERVLWTRPMVVQYLKSLQRGELWGMPIDGEPQVRHDERNGRRLAGVVIHGEHPYDICERTDSGLHEIVGHGREQQKRVYTFDCDQERLVECEQYVLEEGEWRMFERRELDYPDELPEGIFEFDPPPDAKIHDLRER